MLRRKKSLPKLEPWTDPEETPIMDGFVPYAPEERGVLIWSTLTGCFHPVCFMRRSGAMLMAETEHMEACSCVPSCTCRDEVDFEAGLTGDVGVTVN